MTVPDGAKGARSQGGANWSIGESWSSGFSREEDLELGKTSDNEEDLELGGTRWAKKTLWPGGTGEDEGETEEHLGLGGTSGRVRGWTQEVIRKSITPD